MKSAVALTKMKSGQSGIISQIEGGQGMVRRLEAMGVRIGKKITKTRGMVLRGPVTVRVGASSIGIGFGMASRILVAVDGEKT